MESRGYAIRKAVRRRELCHSQVFSAGRGGHGVWRKETPFGGHGPYGIGRFCDRFCDRRVSLCFLRLTPYEKIIYYYYHGVTRRQAKILGLHSPPRTFWRSRKKPALRGGLY